MNALVQPVMHPNPALYASPEMIAELALGMDPPYDIAARYGLAAFEFDKLQQQPWFGELVLKKRLELQTDGVVFSYKAGMMAEELWQRLYQAAITGTLAHPLTLDLAKQLTEIGQLKPKAAAAQGSGGGFQINIQINNADVEKAPRRIDGRVEDVKPVTVTIPLDDLPPKPEGLKVPDFDLRPSRPSALTGTPEAQSAAIGAPSQSR